MQKTVLLKQIETPRLIIRPVQIGDEIALNKAIHHSLALLQQWQSWAKDPSIEATRGFVQRGVFAWASGSVVDFPMVVIHKADQKIIGASGYNDRSDIDHGIYEIGYWCDVDYQGQGLISECANALTRYAFEALKADNVIIMMQCENKKSIAVAERLNFINEGIKNRDRLDCVSDLPAKNIIYAAHNMDNLPPLELSWLDKDNSSTNTQMIAWAKEELKITDEKAFASSRTIAKAPWSTVFEINTATELVYLKRTPKDLFLEAEIIRLLRDQCGLTDIPEIINTHSGFCCFIMKKCGDSTLRDFFSNNLNVEILIQALNVYKTQQKESIKIVNDLISLGVPDWRLEQFPSLYNRLIADAHFLTENGLDLKQQQQLHQYSHKVTVLCDKLECYGVPECLNHSDFHDNNIMYDNNTKTTVIIDLGETAINHPFFSLMACLDATKNRYDLSNESAEYKLLETNTFGGWIQNENHLAEAIEVVKELLPVYLLLTQKRFLDAVNLPYNADDPISVKQHSKIHKGFAWFIDNMEAAYGK